MQSASLGSVNMAESHTMVSGRAGLGPRQPRILSPRPQNYKSARMSPTPALMEPKSGSLEVHSCSICDIYVIIICMFTAVLAGVYSL